MRHHSELFVATFNGQISSWLRSKTNLYKQVSNHSNFIYMNRDEYVVVSLNCLSQKYHQKHIKPDHEAYCTLFIEQINPLLEKVLFETGKQNAIYIFIFSGRGIRTTRFVRAGKD